MAESDYSRRGASATVGHPRWYAYAVTLHTLCILFLAAVVSTAHHVVILLNVSLPSDFSLPLAAGAYDGSSAVFQWSGDGCSLIAEVWEENAYCGGECAHRYVPVVIGMRFLFKVQRTVCPRAACFVRQCVAYLTQCPSRCCMFPFLLLNVFCAFNDDSAKRRCAAGRWAHGRWRVLGHTQPDGDRVPANGICPHTAGLEPDPP